MPTPRLPRPIARAALAAMLAALLLGLAGCGSSGSSSTVSPTTYATALCRAVAPFESDIVRRQNALDPASIKSAAQGKRMLVSFLVAIDGDTQRATSRLKAAGVPDVKNGKSIAAAFVGLFNRLSTTLGTAVQQARHLPTGDPRAFKAAATSLGNDVKASMGNLGSSLSQVHSAALETAARKVTACRSLAS